jgi:accessory gene regulator B
MIENLSSKLAIRLLNKIQADDYNIQYEILEYGIECIINMFIPIIIYIAFAVYIKVLPQMLIWLFIFLFYRNLIGGYHANSHTKCIFFSSLYGLAAINSIQLLSCTNLSSKIIILFLLIIIHIFVKPIIHHPEDDSPVYIRKCRIKIYIFIVTSCVLILLFNNTIPSISSAIFTGIISAEILYVIARFKQGK